MQEALALIIPGRDFTVSSGGFAIRRLMNLLSGREPIWVILIDSPQKFFGAPAWVLGAQHEQLLNDVIRRFNW